MSSPHGDDEAARHSTRSDAMETETTPAKVTYVVRNPDPPLAAPGSPGRNDPTFLQNHLTLKRNPSAAKSPNKASLSRTLSLRSDSSHGSSGGRSSILGVVLGDESSPAHSDTLGGISEDVNNCTLKHSSSRATDRSVGSEGTLKSVKSVTALGALPYGTLRLHSGDLAEASDLTSAIANCLRSGDVILVADVSSARFFGCDTFSFSLSANSEFNGLKDVPPGAHFIYAGSSAALSLRNGYWIVSDVRGLEHLGDIVVKQWDKYEEHLTEPPTRAEIQFQKETVPEIFDKLVPYARANDLSTQGESIPKGLHAKAPEIWHRLSFAIKAPVLSRITGKQKNEWLVASTDDCKPSGADFTDPESRDMFHKDQVLTFIFDRGSKTFSEKAVGRARTEQVLDTTSYVEAIIDERCTQGDQDEVVGELQFCYITGMFLGNVACMEQWAHMAKVLFKAYKLVIKRPVLFRQIIETVHAQFVYDEEGVEGSIFDHDSSLQHDLRLALTIFKSRLNEQLLGMGDTLTHDHQQVGNAFEALESWLWKWDWDLRGNYLRSGKLQLEDGEIVDAEIRDLEDEDERGKQKKSDSNEKKAARPRQNSRLKWKLNI